ncbi:hypothetical protein AB0I10_19350 [Streptomyces sp. NPDC050636]|uniref:hypothetical protein n=1 Tax=Streptomyces sp. NPDC050636 TaxID=3154510 RepID=UPI00341AA0A0
MTTTSDVPPGLVQQTARQPAFLVHIEGAVLDVERYLPPPGRKLEGAVVSPGRRAVVVGILRRLRVGGMLSASVNGLS